MISKAAVFFVVVCSLSLLESDENVDAQLQAGAERNITIVLKLEREGVRQGLAMQCYNCIDCKDPFDAKKYNSSKIDCTGSCLKLKTKDTVTRSCFQVLKSDNCEEKGDNAACQCTGNLCNSALMAQTSIVLTLLLTAASLLRIYVL